MIIIAEEEALNANIASDPAYYKTIKEKTIARTVRFLPDYRAVIHAIISGTDWASEAYADYLGEKEQIVYDVFASAPETREEGIGKYHNFRSLICALKEFARLYDVLAERQVPYIDRYLYSFVAYTLVSRNGIQKNGQPCFDVQTEEIRQLYPAYDPDMLPGSIREWIEYGIWAEEEILKSMDEAKAKFLLYKGKENNMEKYTNLEQAIRDPSLVIITDRTSTLIELNRAFVRYKVLPKRQKRFSDYYSNEFLGHNVPEMYALVKEKLTADYDIFGDLPLPSETLIVSEPDLYYKEDSFNSGDTNICFILGHSGSGKSKMARTLEGDDIDHIELDDLLLIKDHFTMDELAQYSDMLYSFFSAEGAKYYIGVEERNSIPKEEYEDKVFVDFVRFAMDYAKRRRENKYIIEGIWIYLYFDDPSEFADYAVFIKGTSFLKSKIRAAKREMQRDRETLQDRKEMFGREVRNYLLDEDKINRYRSFFGDSPDTIFREETNEAAARSEAVIHELNSIDKCFVNDDAGGINAIMKNAEANADLSNWNKLRIINECQAALLDLRISQLTAADP